MNPESPSLSELFAAHDADEIRRAYLMEHGWQLATDCTRLMIAEYWSEGEGHKGRCLQLRDAYAVAVEEEQRG